MVSQVMNGVNVEREYGDKVLTESQWNAVKQLLSDMATLYQTRFESSEEAYNAYDYLGYTARQLADHPLGIPFNRDPRFPVDEQEEEEQDEEPEEEREEPEPAAEYDEPDPYGFEQYQPYDDDEY
ncbi:MAG: hypothetical protein ACXWP0_01135 [Ktedonobacterales bacterium]